MKVAVSGAAGRMGQLIAQTVEDADDLELSGLFGPGHEGSSFAGVDVSADPNVCAGAQVVVETTRPDVALTNIERWASLGAHVVVGTSGVSERDVEAFWPDGQGCLIVPNFSIGAVLMMRFAELAAPHFVASEIIELHHDAKVDAPSGTARSTAERIARSGGRQQRVADALADSAARGSVIEGVNVHSVRLPGLVAHQQVLFGNDGELLTLRHDSTDRASFMPGVLAAIRAVNAMNGVTVGLDDVLGL